MGLHSADYPMDDCGDDALCAAAPEGGEPEVSEDFLQALTLFQSVLAVPRAEPLDAEAEQQGAELFQRTGCTACHAPSLPVEGIQGISAIAAYTDLRRHDLGEELADRRLDGEIIKSRWRTAPLWGIAHLPRAGHLGLLHDGRARSVEEAVLWHAGEADESRRQFMALPNSWRYRNHNVIGCWTGRCGAEIRVARDVELAVTSRMSTAQMSTDTCFELSGC